MTDHPQLRLRYALLKGTTEGLHFVDDVPNGLNCNCVCSHCGKELIARNNPNNKREHHFAHVSGKKCEGARMTTLHKLAQQILKDEKKVMLPAYNKQYVKKEAKLKTFEEIELEAVCKVENSTRRPDCIGYNDSRKQNVWVEIFCRHQIDAIKREEIIHNKQYCIEVNFSDLLNTDYTEASVRERLLTNSEDREWICHPEWDEEELQKEAEAARQQVEIGRMIAEETRLRLVETQRQQEEYQRQQLEEQRKQAELSKSPPRVSISDSFHKSIQVNDNASKSHSSGKRDWVMYAKQMYGDKNGRQTFYNTLKKEYTRVTLENSERLVTEEIRTRINDLLPRTHLIAEVNKIYLELLLAIWVLDKLNHGKVSDLSIFLS